MLAQSMDVVELSVSGASWLFSGPFGEISRFEPMLKVFIEEANFSFCNSARAGKVAALNLAIYGASG